MPPRAGKSWSTIAKKQFMALSGLFLCLFLTVHFAGNLQLFLPAGEAREQFNWYTELLGGNPAIKVAGYITYFALIAHCLMALKLHLENNRAAGKSRYAVARRGEYSPAQARFMGLLGVILLAFTLVHMNDFWFAFHFGDVEQDSQGRKDLYGLVVRSFQSPAVVAFYSISMLALGFHLAHGVQSSFRTLGVHHPRYFVWLKRAGIAFAWIVAAGFAAMPLFVFFTAEAP